MAQFIEGLSKIWSKLKNRTHKNIAKILAGKKTNK